MPNKRFSDRELLNLLYHQRLSQAEAARRLGVSKQAVGQRMKELRTGAVKVTATRGAQEVFDMQINAAQRFERISQDAHVILDLAMGALRMDETAIGKLSEEFEGKDGPTSLKITDPHQLALKAMAEIRGQLKLQVEILGVLADVATVKDFQESVLEVMGEYDPDVRRKILQALNRRRNLARAVQFRP